MSTRNQDKPMKPERASWETIDRFSVYRRAAEKGGTIHVDLPQELFERPYKEFLENVVRFAAAAHYGFTAEMLMEKEGLREFFGYKEDEEKE